MTAFVLRRLLWTIPVLLLVIFITFVMMRQIEGNPFRQTERNVPESIQRNLEAKLTGEDGAMPFIPLWSGTYNNLERETVKETFEINLLDQVDLTKVVVTE